MNDFNPNSSYPLIGNQLIYNTKNPDEIRIPQVQFIDRVDIIPQLLVKPSKTARPDILGILMLKTEYNHLPLPKCIPIVVAISELNTDQKCQTDYETTNIENLYCVNISTNNKQLSEKMIAVKERKKLEAAIESISTSGKLLRVLIHPNIPPTSSESERMNRIHTILSKGKDTISTVCSNNSAVLTNNNCVLELHKVDLDQLE